MNTKYTAPSELDGRLSDNLRFADKKAGRVASPACLFLADDSNAIFRLAFLHHCPLIEGQLKDPERAFLREGRF